MAQAGTAHEGVSYVCVQAPLPWCTILGHTLQAVVHLTLKHHGFQSPVWQSWRPGNGNLPVGSAIQPCSVLQHNVQIPLFI